MKASETGSPAFYHWLLLLLALLVATGIAPARAADGKQGEDIRIMQSFAQGQDEKSEIVQITDKQKSAIMFYMGVPLILLLLTTAGLGVAMVLYRKPVFLAHMIFAGLSLTLALAHAIVGTVWFYPF